MIIEYDSKYNEQIKDLLVQLQQYLEDMDKEGYNESAIKFYEKNGYHIRMLED